MENRKRKIMCGTQRKNGTCKGMLKSSGRIIDNIGIARTRFDELETSSLRKSSVLNIHTRQMTKKVHSKNPLAALNR